MKQQLDKDVKLNFGVHKVIILGCIFIFKDFFVFIQVLGMLYNFRLPIQSKPDILNLLL